MLDYNKNQTILRRATEIVMKLHKKDFVLYDDTDSFREWVTKAAAFVFAYIYGYDEYDNEENFYDEWIINYVGKNKDVHWFRGNVEKIRHLFESYNYRYDDDNLWTLAAYLWQNEVGDEYALSIYERECLDDPYYQEMGSIIKSVIKK